MCRSFKEYKLTYGCFGCQIGFKRRNLADAQPKLYKEMLEKAQIAGTYLRIDIKDFHCPNCGGEIDKV